EDILARHTGRRGDRVMTGEEFIAISGARCLVATPTAVVRSALLKMVGGYLPEFPHAGDMEMWLRLAAHAGVGFVATPQAVYRMHGDNMSRAYQLQKKLPDLLQRIAVTDHFIASCGHLIPDPNGTRLRLKKE